MTTLGNPTNFTQIATSSGTALQAVGTQTGYTFVGASGVSTSATGSTITVTGSGGGTGSIVQQVRTTSPTIVGSASIASFSSFSTVPTTSNTALLVTLAITPTSTSNKLIFDFSGLVGTSASGSSGAILALFNGTTLLWSGVFNYTYISAGAYVSFGNASWEYILTAPATSIQTYTIRGVPFDGVGSTDSIYLNSNLGGAVLGSTPAYTFRITEVTP